MPSAWCSHRKLTGAAGGSTGTRNGARRPKPPTVERETERRALPPAPERVHGHEGVVPGGQAHRRRAGAGGVGEAAGDGGARPGDGEGPRGGGGGVGPERHRGLGRGGGGGAEGDVHGDGQAPGHVHRAGRAGRRRGHPESGVGAVAGRAQRRDDGVRGPVQHRDRDRTPVRPAVRRPRHHQLVLAGRQADDGGVEGERRQRPRGDRRRRARPGDVPAPRDRVDRDGLAPGDANVGLRARGRLREHLDLGERERRRALVLVHAHGRAEQRAREGDGPRPPDAVGGRLAAALPPPARPHLRPGPGHLCRDGVRVVRGRAPGPDPDLSHAPPRVVGESQLDPLVGRGRQAAEPGAARLPVAGAVVVAGVLPVGQDPRGRAARRAGDGFEPQRAVRDVDGPDPAARLLVPQAQRDPLGAARGAGRPEERRAVPGQRDRPPPPVRVRELEHVVPAVEAERRGVLLEVPGRRRGRHVVARQDPGDVPADRPALDGHDGLAAGAAGRGGRGPARGARPDQGHVVPAPGAAAPGGLRAEGLRLRAQPQPEGRARRRRRLPCVPDLVDPGPARAVGARAAAGGVAALHVPERGVWVGKATVGGAPAGVAAGLQPVLDAHRADRQVADDPLQHVAPGHAADAAVPDARPHGGSVRQPLDLHVVDEQHHVLRRVAVLEADGVLHADHEHVVELLPPGVVPVHRDLQERPHEGAGLVQDEGHAEVALLIQEVGTADHHPRRALVVLATLVLRQADPDVDRDAGVPGPLPRVNEAPVRGAVVHRRSALLHVHLTQSTREEIQRKQEHRQSRGRSKNDRQGGQNRGTGEKSRGREARDEERRQRERRQHTVKERRERREGVQGGALPLPVPDNAV